LVALGLSTGSEKIIVIEFVSTVQSVTVKAMVDLLPPGFADFSFSVLLTQPTAA
jgi:hypothetical protein